jgi:nitrogen fixation-related uncharacterized protein
MAMWQMIVIAVGVIAILGLFWARSNEQRKILQRR